MNVISDVLMYGRTAPIDSIFHLHQPINDLTTSDKRLKFSSYHSLNPDSLPIFMHARRRNPDISEIEVWTRLSGNVIVIIVIETGGTAG